MITGIDGLRRHLEENEGQFSMQEIVNALEDGNFLRHFFEDDFEDDQDNKNKSDIENLHNFYCQKLETIRDTENER